MSNLSLHPLLRRSIGFDRLNDLFEYSMQSEAPNYPPYNIEKHSDNEYRIVIATAGFTPKELDINLENSVLPAHAGVILTADQRTTALP